MPVPTPPTTPSTPPLAPQRTEPTTFSARMDAWLTWFNSSFWSWIYNVVPWIQARANETEAWSNSASASATAAAVSQTVAAEATATATAAITTVTQQAQAAAANSATISSVAAAASASASAAAASSAAAATSADRAVAAWSASTSPVEQLASFAPSIHIGAIVKSVIYDTSKDSDGGAWRKRCQDKSWFNETLGGDRWIGQQATIAAAWTAAGSLTGAVFQASATAGPLTSGKYYQATSATTATEVFRGISREFPALAAIVAESGRVVIYDLTQASCPMWMVFTGSASNWLFMTTLTSVAALNGGIIVGGSTGMCEINFILETNNLRTASGLSRTKGNLSQRNTGLGFTFIGATGAIVNHTVNDVAITVLETAPTDPATGLPVPTIAAFTAGGVTVIKDNGAAINIGTANAQYTGSFAGSAMYVSGVNGSTVGIWKCPDVTAASPVVVNYYATYGMAQFDLTDSNAGTKHIKTPKGLATMRTTQLALLYENPADATKGLHAHITNAYNTGWQVGDSRLAALADTVAETVTATDIGWPSASLTVASFTGAGLASWDITDGGDRIRITRNASAYAGVPTISGSTYVNGAWYKFSFNILAISAGATAYYSVTNGGVGQLIGNIYPGSVGLYLNDASPTNQGSNKPVIQLSAARPSAPSLALAGDYIEVSKTLSIQLTQPDRSVKATGLVINGTLTKTAVASGAGLVAYSGFSASNYLEQAYNSQLDFGTGDFCVMGWMNTSINCTMASRGDGVSAGSWKIKCISSSAFVFYIHNGTSLQVTLNTNPPAKTLTFVTLVKSSGTLYLYFDGVLAHSIASALTVSNATAKLRVGQMQDEDYANSATNLSLFRISATAPSADQIAHIYRTELPLFQPNAQCTIAGTSTAVTALAYDDVADELHVGTSWGRTEFKDLLRVASEATTTGAITSLSASEGVILTGGTSGKIYAPAMYLRDELRRKDQARRALGRTPAFFDYTATASQTAFVAPAGFTVKALYKNGTLMRETTTGVYWTRSNDGFRETATLSVGASVSDWISIMCVRS